MSEYLFLARVLIERTLIALVVVCSIYNPWFSLYQVIAPGDSFSLLDLQSGLLYKAIAVLFFIGILYAFFSLTTEAMGKRRVAFILVFLGLVAYIPFQAEWLDVTVPHVGNIVYFFVVPVLIGLGLWTGTLKRWVAGTLLVTPTGHGGDRSLAHTGGHHPADPGHNNG